MNTNYYDYNELKEKATASGATKEDRLNLLYWFESFGRDYWHFDHYAMENDIRLFPVWEGIGEPDEDGEFWNYELVDADIRY